MTYNIYYHEGKDDEVFMMGKERTDVISRELRLFGYFCIITSAKMNCICADDKFRKHKVRNYFLF